MTEKIYKALTLAGSDPSGGAGIQADLKTFHQRRVYGMGVITLLTVQNTMGVTQVHPVDPLIFTAQIDAVLDDIPPDAAKTGALGSAEIVEALAVCAKKFKFPLVVDPVMISKHGAPLAAEDAVSKFRDLLLPFAALVTPNLHEAMKLTGVRFSGENSLLEMAKVLAGFGAKAVLIKGGHLKSGADDFLYEGGEFVKIPGQRVRTRHTHGTGCAYAACITAEMAKGYPLRAAVETSKKFIASAIASSPGFGHGQGPVNHFAEI